MEHLIKVEKDWSLQSDVWAKSEPYQDKLPLKENAKSQEKVQTKVNTSTVKNSHKTRELYVKLVRFDAPPVKKPAHKIRVKDFGVLPNDEPVKKPASPERRKNQTKPEPQGGTSLAAKLMQAYFRRSPRLQTILSDVLLLQKNCEIPISDSSIESEIRVIKEQYNLSFVYPNMEVIEETSQDEDSIFEEAADSSTELPESGFCLSSTGENNDGMTTSDTKLINIELDNGLVFELDPNVAECPICSRSFQAFHSLKQHLKYCFAVSSNMKTVAPNQNEPPGPFVLTQELSIDSPLKIQQVFSADNMPADLRPPAHTASKGPIRRKDTPKRVNFILPPKSASPTPETTEVHIKQEEHFSPSTSQVDWYNVEEAQQKISGPLYYCCWCDQIATSQKELVMNCSATRKSTKKKSVTCLACKWNYPSEPFFLLHNSKFRELGALPLKCSTCKCLMYNHDMFVSHEVRKTCKKVAETITKPVNSPSDKKSNEVIVIE